MKLKLVTSALILAAVGSASLAQGMEGQEIGYAHEKSNGVTYSASNGPDRVTVEERRVHGERFSNDARFEKVTVYSSTANPVEIQRAPR